jgi:hypothetical protein
MKVIAMETEQQSELANQESELNREENAIEGILATVKPFLLGIGILAFVMTLWVLLPMFLTYLSEGDARPPSQIHHADPAGKSDRTVYKPLKSNK